MDYQFRKTWGSKTRSEDSVTKFVFGKWIAYLCAVGNYGLALGLPFSMSVLFVDWQSTFGATRAQTAAVYSTYIGILFGAAIIPGFIMDRFGARFTVVLGSCLACLGCITSSFATSINFLIISNGVMGGLGFCFLQLPSMTTVNMAFTSRYRSLAVSVCASCVALSSMTFPFLYRYLVRQYSWRPTLAIIGGLCLQTAVLGFLMTSYERRPCSNKGSAENRMSLISPEQAVDTLESKEKNDCMKHREEESVCNSCGGDVHSKKEISIPVSSCQYIARKRTGCCCSSKLRNSRWKFLLNCTYIIYVLYLCASLATMFSFILMMMDFSRTKGFEDEDTGAFFLFVIFMTSLFGRLVVGALNLIPFLHSITLLGICGIVISSALIVLGNVSEYSTIVGFLAVTGLGSGGILGIYTKAILDIDGVNLDVYPLALGLAGLVEGVFDVSTPIMIGYSVDATGSYALILQTLGSISLIVSLALILTQEYSTYRTCKKGNGHPENL